ncbi:MAG: hypothetical protein WBE86_04930 [Candidatus Acidiferrales bacterium]
MKDGAARIDLTEGEVTRVSVGTGLDDAYGRLFQTASTEACSTPSRDAGVKVILFGCFWLEAVCNTHLREFMQGLGLAEPIQTSLWNAIERVRTGAKLDILASISPPATKEILKQARKLFELRNRLAHFKEEFTEVAGPYSLDEEFFNKLPEAELIKSLKPPALDASITDILQTKAWLDQVKQTIDDLQNLGTKMLR